MSRRILVTGSRDWVDPGTIDDALSQHVLRGDIVVHGACATGADEQADAWASDRGVEIERWPARWRELGRRAGPVRNQAMVDSRPDLVLAFIRNASRGATHCLNAARDARLPVVVYRRDER